MGQNFGLKNSKNTSIWPFIFSLLSKTMIPLSNHHIKNAEHNSTHGHFQMWVTRQLDNFWVVWLYLEGHYGSLIVLMWNIRIWVINSESFNETAFLAQPQYCKHQKVSVSDTTKKRHCFQLLKIYDKSPAHIIHFLS